MRRIRLCSDRAAEMAGAAAKIRDAGVSSEGTVAIVGKQVPEGLERKLNATVGDVYSHHELTPGQLAAKILQERFQSEVF
jgi:hypothetical protein